MLKSIRTVIALGLLLVWAMVPSRSDAAGPFGTVSVGNWHGGAYTDDKSGAFTHCAAGATYQNGIYFMVSVGQDNSLTLGFAQDSWQLTTGRAFPLEITLDGQQPINVHGLPIGPHLVSVSMPTNSTLVTQFRKATLMSVFAAGHLFQFTLSQTGQLLPSLLNCVQSVKKNGVDKAGEFTVTQPKPVAAKAPAQSGGSAPKSGRTSSDKTVTVSGTGFVVSNKGHVVTNAHVVGKCVGDIEGTLGGTAPVKLRLVSSDKRNDLALLQAPAPFKEIATIRDKPMHSGDSVVAIGYPLYGLLTSDFTVTTGIVSSLSGIGNDTRFLQISAAVQPGNSGGPLFDTNGQIVGVVSEKLDQIVVAQMTGSIPENINFAIKTGTLRDFLDNSVVPYQTADAKSELTTPEIARNAREFTLLIRCSVSEKSANAEKSDN
jgi:S1-C subfamily serine protease